ncbi:MAG: sugar ABC transporter ATP-binding protein [Spirochaetales bacterium]|nr:MAG: sugar ABC transporter ATP-binding protein [Spirochaetales bacterium]
MGMTVLEAKHIRKYFVGVKALSDANFILREGEVCGLVGANGSGKTTFARVISGLLRPDGGELLLYEKPVNLKSHLDAEQYRMAMVHQNLSLVPEMTIWENIALGREPGGALGLLDNRTAVEQARKALAVIGVNLSPHERVRNVSPDEKQLIEIAKALAKDPRILILDEPTASLDFHQVEALFKAVVELKAKGVSIVFISHRIWEVAKICDRLVAFRNGETVGELDFSVQERDENLIVPLITGRKVKARAGRDAAGRESEITALNTGAPALEIRGLSLAGGRLADINLTLRRGEILGLGGLQRQGQEEILMILAGYMHGYSGQILIDGTPLALRNTRQAIRRGIVLIPGDRQKEGLFLQHSVQSNLLYPKISMHRGSFFLPMGGYQKLAAEAVDKVSLVPPNLRLNVSQLSGGNQQKVVVGKWLTLNPSVLLLNDPTKGVDVGTRENIYEIISALTAQGASVLLYASDNEELINNCDRVLIVFEGKIVKEICGDDISEEKIVVSSLNVEHAGEAAEAGRVL